jgi:hypothetical protein
MYWFFTVKKIIYQGLQCGVFGVLYTLHLTQYTKCNDGVKTDFFYTSMKSQSKKKFKCSLYIFIFSFYIYFLNFFLKKPPKITQSKIFTPIFFRSKKNTLHHTNFFFKALHSVFLKHRFLFYTVYCAGVIFANFWCTPECKC